MLEEFEAKSTQLTQSLHSVEKALLKEREDRKADAKKAIETTAVGEARQVCE